MGTTNEPVAWMDEINTFVLDKDYKQFPKSLQNGMIPLYTHPVKELGNPVAWRSKDRDGYWCIYQSPVKGAEPLYTGFKELTDEEIGQVWKNMPPDNDSGLAFARAILKKAQEK